MEEHRSMAIQVTGPTDEETSPGLDDDFVSLRAQQRSLATQASEMDMHTDTENVIEPVRSFGVQASAPDTVEVSSESDDDEYGTEQQRSFAVQVSGTQDGEPVTTTDDSRMIPNHLIDENDLRSVDTSHSSSRHDTDEVNITRSSDCSHRDHSLIGSHTRTIETQTYPDLRVIETQTSMETHGMQTQTSPKRLVEGEATQTELSKMEEISVQTPVEMITSGLSYCSSCSNNLLLPYQLIIAVVFSRDDNFSTPKLKIVIFL